MKVKKLSILLAGTASVASQVAKTVTTSTVVKAESREEVEKMNDDAENVVKQFHKNGGGGTSLTKKADEAKKVPHLTVKQDPTKVIHSSVQSIQSYDVSARHKIQKQVSNLDDAIKKQKQNNEEYEKALQARNDILQKNKNAQAKIDSLKQERASLEQKLAEAQKEGIKLVHDQDQIKEVTTTNVSQATQDTKRDYDSQKQALDQAQKEHQVQVDKAIKDNNKAQDKIDQANKNNNDALVKVTQKASQVEGVTVTQDQDQSQKVDAKDIDQASQNNQQDIQSQIDNINKQIADWQQKYSQLKADYEQALTNYRRALQFNPKGLTSDQVNQGLNLGEEKDATLDIQVPDSLKPYFTGTQLANLPHQDINGTVMTITYSNLKNTYYKDSNGQVHQLTKLVRTLSNAKAQKVPDGTKDMMRIIVDSNDPRAGINGDLVYSLDINDSYYDNNGNHVAMGNNAYYVPSSQNAEYINEDASSFVKTSSEPATRQFYRGLNGSKALSFAGSSVTVHDDGTAYSDVTNDPYTQLRVFALDNEKGFDPATPEDASAFSDFIKQYNIPSDTFWDDPYSPYMFWGAGLLTPDSNGDFSFTQGMQVSPKTMSVDKDGHLVFNHNAMNREWWLSFITSIPDTHSPAKPTLNLHWHKSNVALNQEQPESKEFHYHFTDLKLNPDKVPDEPILKETEVHYHNVDLALDPHPLPDPSKTITVITDHEKKIGQQTIQFVDKNTGNVLTTVVKDGEVGKDVSVSLKVPKGYHLVQGQKVPSSVNIKDNDNPITIYVEKGASPAKPSTPENKNGKQTIHIIDKKTGNYLTTVVKDGKIGENVPVSLKVPAGYHLIKGQKLPTSVNIKDKDNAIEVYVEKNESKSTEITRSDDNSKTPVESAKASDKAVKPNIRDAKTPSSPVSSNTTAPKHQATLPQTGDSSSTAGVLAGSTLLATMASLGIAYKKKHNA